MSSLSPSADHRPSDATLIDLLRVESDLGVGEIAARMGVTATAVRQRLDRLMRAGLIGRTVETGAAKPDREAPAGRSAKRGRPSHTYSLTDKGRRTGGDNFRDLALVLWREIRSVREPAVRRGLIARIGSAMAGMYRDDLAGETPRQRLESTVEILRSRQIACGIETSAGRTTAAADGSPAHVLPVLASYACPYPELAEQDRGICVAERLMLQDLIGSAVRLSDCRLDGADCCRFTVGDAAGPHPDASPLPSPATCIKPD